MNLNNQLSMSITNLNSPKDTHGKTKSKYTKLDQTKKKSNMNLNKILKNPKKSIEIDLTSPCGSASLF